MKAKFKENAEIRLASIIKIIKKELYATLPSLKNRKPNL